MSKAMEATNKLEDHIDEPIKKAVVGMSLLGFKTYMSCCGFSYDNEKVYKSHLEKAYIYLDSKQITESTALSRRLLSLACLSGWAINPNVPFVDFYGKHWEENHPWKTKTSVHNYEVFLLSISRLNKAIETMKNEFLDFTVEIKDGNHHYIEEVSSFWQYKPTESWFVNRNTYEALNF